MKEEENKEEAENAFEKNEESLPGQLGNDLVTGQDGSMEEIPDGPVEEIPGKVKEDIGVPGAPVVPSEIPSEGIADMEVVWDAANKQDEDQSPADQPTADQISGNLSGISSYIKPFSLEEAKRMIYRVKMPRGKINKILDAFKYLANNVPDTQGGGRWGNFITKNAKKLYSVEMDTMKKMAEYFPDTNKDPRIKEYNDFEFELFTEYAKKDELGNPILNTETNRFVINTDSEKEFEEKMKILREDYKDVMEMYNQAYMKGEVIKGQTVDFEPHCILQSFLPSGLLPIYYEILEPFIIED